MTGSGPWGGSTVTLGTDRVRSGSANLDECDVNGSFQAVKLWAFWRARVWFQVTRACPARSGETLNSLPFSLKTGQVGVNPSTYRHSIHHCRTQAEVR